MRLPFSCHSVAGAVDRHACLHISCVGGAGWPWFTIKDVWRGAEDNWMDQA